nr:uncharacterized protein LOC113800444 [Penaeus vannamei]
MNVESEWWWAWSGAAGGAWAAVVCVVVVMGGAVNVAVVIHWATSRPAQDSPSAALPCVDLLLCVLAAPLRYAHAPPIPTPAGSRLVAEATLAPQNISGGALQLDATGKVANASTPGTDWEAPLAPPGPGTSLAHAVVVGVCLTSLHVVVIVALHRLTLLLKCSVRGRKPFRFASPLLVVAVALAAAVALWAACTHGTLHGYVPSAGRLEAPPSWRPAAALGGGLPVLRGRSVRRHYSLLPDYHQRPHPPGAQPGRRRSAAP